eukprot:gene5863-7292_t
MSNDIDNEYFDSYFDLNVHEVMLKDQPRTLSYKNAIELNSIDFKDKIVLDVGAGTGILSMFAAKAGAKKVYAVEGSFMATYCQKLVESNGFGSVIKVVDKIMENVTIKDIEEGQVDIIISEWMGFYLFHESMLESVLDARDRWLRPGGIIFPSRADLLMSPINLDRFMQKRLGFWKDVYGFNFTDLIEPALESLSEKPLTEYFDKDQLVSTPKILKSMDFNIIKKEELRELIFKDLEFKIPENSPVNVHGFCIWFICYFDGTKTTVSLSTAPGDPKTHWKQTTILLPQTIPLNGGETIPLKL